MALAHPDSAFLFVSLLHEYSLIIEQWRKFSESKSCHIFQLQEHLQQQDAANKKLRSQLAENSQVIADLEYKLECQRQSASAFCNAPVPAESPSHREIHNLENCCLSCSPSCLMLDDASSPVATVSFDDDEVCELEGEERAPKRRRTDDGE